MSNFDTMNQYRRKELQADVRRGVTSRVLILASPLACRACRKLRGRVFAVDSAPELPYAECTNPQGCRCSYVAVPANPEGKDWPPPTRMTPPQMR